MKTKAAVILALLSSTDGIKQRKNENKLISLKGKAKTNYDFIINCNGQKYGLDCDDFSNPLC